MSVDRILTRNERELGKSVGQKLTSGWGMFSGGREHDLFARSPSPIYLPPSVEMSPGKAQASSGSAGSFSPMEVAEPSELGSGYRPVSPMPSTYSGETSEESAEDSYISARSSGSSDYSPGELTW